MTPTRTTRRRCGAHYPEPARKLLEEIVKSAGYEWQRIMSCTDTDQLDRWVKRAAVIDNIEDLLG